MRPGRLLLTVLAALSILALIAPSASAGGLDSENGGGTGDNRAGERVDLSGGTVGNTAWLTLGLGIKDGRTVSPTPLPRWMLACTWQVKTRAQHVTWVSSFEGGRTPDFTQPPPTSRSGSPVGTTPTVDDWNEEWVAVICPEGKSNDQLTNLSVNFNGVLEAWPVVDVPPAAIGTFLVYAALAQVEAPVDVGISSPPGDTDIPMITQLATWLWLDDTHRVARSASATILNYTATVTVTPELAHFVAGQADGHQEAVTCTMADMVPYDLDKTDDQQDTDCKLFYRHASGDNFLATTVQHSVAYTCNAICGTGTLDDIAVENIRPVTVQQWLAINN